MPFKILFYLVRISDRIINPFEWAPHFKIYYISGVYAKQVAPLKLPDALLKKTDDCPRSLPNASNRDLEPQKGGLQCQLTGAAFLHNSPSGILTRGFSAEILGLHQWATSLII